MSDSSQLIKRVVRCAGVQTVLYSNLNVNKVLLIVVGCSEFRYMLNMF